MEKSSETKVVEKKEELLKKWSKFEQEKIIAALNLEGRSPTAEDFYGLSRQIRVMRELPFDTLAEVLHHAVRQNDKISRDYLKDFRRKYHWCFFNYSHVQRRETESAEEDMIAVSELVRIICDWIVSAEHKEFQQRKCFKLDLQDFLLMIKIEIPDDYKNKLMHLDDVQVGEDQGFPNNEQNEVCVDCNENQLSSLVPPDNLCNYIFNKGEDLRKIWEWIRVHFLPVHKYDYDWFALLRYLADNNKLEKGIKTSNTKFAKQMQEWFPSYGCKPNGVKLYRTGYLGGNSYRIWNKAIFSNKIKAGQTIGGFIHLNDIINRNLDVGDK